MNKERRCSMTPQQRNDRRRERRRQRRQEESLGALFERLIELRSEEGDNGEWFDPSMTVYTNGSVQVMYDECVEFVWANCGEGIVALKAEIAKWQSQSTANSTGYTMRSFVESR